RSSPRSRVGTPSRRGRERQRPASAADGGLDLVGLLRYARAEHLGTSIGDEDVVLDADPADIGVARENVAAQVVAEGRGVARLAQDPGNLVETGLDGDRHARDQIPIEAEVGVAKAWRSL